MTKREVLQREIAAILDHPSVFMGGPSRQSLKTAGRVLQHLEAENVLHIGGEQEDGK